MSETVEKIVLRDTGRCRPPAWYHKMARGQYL